MRKVTKADYPSGNHPESTSIDLPLAFVFSTCQGLPLQHGETRASKAPSPEFVPKPAVPVTSPTATGRQVSTMSRLAPGSTDTWRFVGLGWSSRGVAVGVGQSAGQLAAWLAGWLVGGSVGRSVSRLMPVCSLIAYSCLLSSAPNGCTTIWSPLPPRCKGADPAPRQAVQLTGLQQGPCKGRRQLAQLNPRRAIARVPEPHLNGHTPRLPTERQRMSHAGSYVMNLKKCTDSREPSESAYRGLYRLLHRADSGSTFGQPNVPQLRKDKRQRVGLLKSQTYPAP